MLNYFCVLAGLGAGTTARGAVAVVTPIEVGKIRLQAQIHSLADHWKFFDNEMLDVLYMPLFEKRELQHFIDVYLLRR